MTEDKDQSLQPFQPPQPLESGLLNLPPRREKGTADQLLAIIREKLGQPPALTYEAKDSVERYELGAKSLSFLVVDDPTDNRSVTVKMTLNPDDGYGGFRGGEGKLDLFFLERSKRHALFIETHETRGTRSKCLVHERKNCDPKSYKTDTNTIGKMYLWQTRIFDTIRNYFEELGPVPMRLKSIHEVRPDLLKPFIEVLSQGTPNEESTTRWADSRTVDRRLTVDEYVGKYTAVGG